MNEQINNNKYIYRQRKKEKKKERNPTKKIGAQRNDFQAEDDVYCLSFG